MLISAHLTEVPAVERLVQLWAKRYTPDLSPLDLAYQPLLYGQLVQAATPDGRDATAAKLRESLVDLKCQLAAIQARSLYEYIPNIVDLREARHLTTFTFQVYVKLLKLYQQPAARASSAIDRLQIAQGTVPLTAWGIPDIAELAAALEPILLKFQQQHMASRDWRTLGFITTQLNFANKLLLHKLTPIEAVLISPYLKFVEEQVAVPWQRVCAAAAAHALNAPALALVEQIFPLSDTIAQLVYRQLVQQYPDYHSRRGKLSRPEVAHSCLRDLNMFQAYLWLCLLQGSLAPLEQELVPLCSMVMETMGVKWEVTARWNQFLMREILIHTNSDQRALLLPYTEGMERLFHARRLSLGATL